MKARLHGTCGLLFLLFYLGVLPTAVYPSDLPWDNAGCLSGRDLAAEAAKFEEDCLSAIHEEEGRGKPTARLAENLGRLASLHNWNWHAVGPDEAREKIWEARRLRERALAVWEAVLGPEHPDLVKPLRALYDSYAFRDVVGDGRYREAKAEAILKRIVAISEKAFRPSDPPLIESLNDLAHFYSGQWKYAQAEQQYKRALAILEEAGGPDDPRLAPILNRLGSVYNRQFRYAEAERVFKRALATCEKTLGPDYDKPERSLANLVRLYRLQARYAEAEPLLERVLAIREKKWGPSRGNVAAWLAYMAEFYTLQDKHAEAETLLKRALDIFKIQDNFLVAETRLALAEALSAQGKYTKAEPLFQRSLKFMERYYGPEDIRLARILEHYAGLLATLDREDEAGQLAARAKAIRAQRSKGGAERRPVEKQQEDTGNAKVQDLD